MNVDPSSKRSVERDGIGANLTFLSMAEIKELFQTPMQANKNS
jgi:hypothetical protein